MSWFKCRVFLLFIFCYFHYYFPSYCVLFVSLFILIIVIIGPDVNPFVQAQLKEKRQTKPPFPTCPLACKKKEEKKPCIHIMFFSLDPTCRTHSLYHAHPLSLHNPHPIPSPFSLDPITSPRIHLHTRPFPPSPFCTQKMLSQFNGDKAENAKEREGKGDPLSYLRKEEKLGGGLFFDLAEALTFLVFLKTHTEKRRKETPKDSWP